MKRIGFGVAAALAFAGAATAGDVTVELKGVQARGGTVYAALQSRGEFMQPKSTYGVKAESPKAGVLRLTIPNVKPGDYALSVLHDQDGNGQMKLSPQFIPEEGWAMTNGDNLTAQPTFDLVKVSVPATGSTVTANMHYYDGKVPAR